MRSIRFAIAAVVAVSPLLAGEDLIIPLKFIPTTKPGAVHATLQEGVSGKSIALDVQDARTVGSRDIIGEGTGSGDDTFRIRFAGHLPGYLKTTITDRFNAWGVLFDDKSNLVLTIRVTRFHVLETHSFMNSTFTAEVQLPYTLADRAGHVFAEGTAMGNGKTKGRWRNPVNCEEVLSDALQQAGAVLMSDSKLQEAWIASKPEAGAVAETKSAAPLKPVVMAVPPSRVHSKTAPASLPKTPAQLLTDVTRLRKQQMGTDLLVDYVSQQTIATGFSADDLVAWKKAGIPEPVMHAAMQKAGS
ncbi:MAG TPA: YajG family lipoprotein [Candidatus Polarisedimenticolaceae bacterium]|nr:YajG family lipoprotein [Candidatus Polarisedimenticolaceae bacterium]